MPSPELRRSRNRPPIIGGVLLALCLLLEGCSIALKLGYNQGGTLAFRWLDSYVDFDEAQAGRVRTALDEWFAWHRRSQLPDYADLLARAQVDLADDISPERMCGWATEVRSRLDLGLERATPAIADLMLTLTPQQIASIEKRNAEKNDEFRDDFLQRDPQRRRRAAIRRELERAEDLYGRLDEAQRELVTRAVAESPFDPVLVLQERKRRQQDAVAGLRRLIAARAGRGEAEAEVRVWSQRLMRSPRDDYRRHAERLTEYNCSFAASLHNATTPAQRRTAARKLKGYEDDVRALAGEAPS